MAPEEMRGIVANELMVYVPRPGSALGESILPGSAVCGRLQDNGRVLIDYEGNRYGSMNMRTFEEKLLHAAGRHIENYPTVARAMVKSADLIAVGRYDYETKTLSVDNRDALLGWTGEDGYPGA